MVVKELVKIYIEHYFIPKGRSYKGTEEYRFQQIVAEFGDRRLKSPGGMHPGDLKLFEIEVWVNKLREKKCAPATIKKLVARLRAVINWGVTRDRRDDRVFD